MREYFVDFIAGSISGIFGALVGHPFDTLKCRLQAEKWKYKSLIIGAKLTLKKEGFVGLYKGLWANFATTFIINAVLFSEFGRAKRFLKKHNYTNKTFIYFTSGAYAGLMSLFLSVPIELIKCRQQLASCTAVQAHSFVYNIKEILILKGIRGLYTGYWSTFNRDVYGFGLYFLTYYYLKDFFISRYGKFSNMEVCLVGALAGINSWVFTFPFDTIKTVIQATPPEIKTPSQYKIFKKLLQQTGYKSLFSGLTPTILLACSLNGAVFIGFEVTHRYLERFINK